MYEKKPHLKTKLQSQNVFSHTENWIFGHLVCFSLIQMFNMQS